ncbi:hypothetical protein Tco_1156003 [Tanacetum coccineum]
MSSDSASSEVTYTSISSYRDSLAWAVDLFGLQEPDLPEAAPASPDYVPVPVEPEQAPPSPDYVLGYVANSDPEEDPEEDSKEGPVDYPTDGGDNDDDDDSSDDDEEEEEASEEEEHLALAESVIAPAVDHAPMPFPLEAEVERLLALPPLPPSPLISLLPPSAEERLARCLAAPALPSSSLPIVPHLYGSPNHVHTPLGWCLAAPALPSSLLPPLPASLFIPPSVDRREEILEAELPPHKRLCLTALTSRYEVGESSNADPRPTRGHRIDYGFIGTLDVETRRQRAKEVGYGIRDVWVDLIEAVEEPQVFDDTRSIDFSGSSTNEAGILHASPSKGTNNGSSGNQHSFMLDTYEMLCCGPCSALRSSKFFQDLLGISKHGSQFTSLNSLVVLVPSCSENQQQHSPSLETELPGLRTWSFEALSLPLRDTKSDSNLQLSRVGGIPGQVLRKDFRKFLDNWQFFMSFSPIELSFVLVAGIFVRIRDIHSLNTLEALVQRVDGFIASASLPSYNHGSNAVGVITFGSINAVDTKTPYRHSTPYGLHSPFHGSISYSSVLFLFWLLDSMVVSWHGVLSSDFFCSQPDISSQVLIFLSMSSWRTQWHPALVFGLGAAQCHGSVSGKPLRHISHTWSISSEILPIVISAVLGNTIGLEQYLSVNHLVSVPPCIAWEASLVVVLTWEFIPILHLFSKQHKESNKLPQVPLKFQGLVFMESGHVLSTVERLRESLPEFWHCLNFPRRRTLTRGTSTISDKSIKNLHLPIRIRVVLAMAMSYQLPSTSTVNGGGWYMWFYGDDSGVRVMVVGVLGSQLDPLRDPHVSSGSPLALISDQISRTIFLVEYASDVTEISRAGSGYSRPRVSFISCSKLPLGTSAQEHKSPIGERVRRLLRGQVCSQSDGETSGQTPQTFPVIMHTDAGQSQNANTFA